ncbi:glycosyltransferase family 2 protein [uncultured Tateyamaria sp.]|uniref:glycosyltransferase family 2 protein n=1 Tax=uncultured Tateyamaria sp. TaxID=455651 RepID=UPI002638A9E9|nr:glycosyltransferase family 2 protein [uncultured Tateyamaria sp.]
MTSYRMRWKRRRLLWRSWRSRHQLTSVADRTAQIGRRDVVAVMTVRNEQPRLAYFYKHYRALGVTHFLVVDNQSDDGTFEFLRDQQDTSVWRTDHSYRGSRFGVDWMTWLQMKYCHRIWSLTLDADELLVYAHHDTRSLTQLTKWLEDQGRSVFGAMMLDLYPRGALGEQTDNLGENPLDHLQWFDAGQYRSMRQQPAQNLWVQGGARERVFFQRDTRRSPTLNKIPLIKWDRSFAYLNSCHSALPPRLNHGYDGPGSDDPSGVLLHTKFLPNVVGKAREDMERRQHFSNPAAMKDYYDTVLDNPRMWTPESTKYEDWRQLEALGLMSSGGWN